MSVVDLTDTEWGEVMAIVSEAPWRRANPLLMKIGEQLRQQHQAAVMPHAPPGPRIEMPTNGKEGHHE